MLLVMFAGLWWSDPFRCRALGVDCPTIRDTMRVDPPPVHPISAVLPWRTPSDVESRPQVSEVYDEGLPVALHDTLLTLAGRGERINSVAVDHGGQWLVVTDSNVVHSGAPSGLLRHLAGLRENRSRARQVTFMPWGGGWAVVDDHGHLEQSGARADLPSATGEENEGIRGIALSTLGWVLLRSAHGSRQGGELPARLRDVLRTEVAMPLRSLALAPNNAFVAVQSDGACVYENVPESLARHLDSLCASGRVEFAALSPDRGGWVLIADPESARR